MANHSAPVRPLNPPRGSGNLVPVCVLVLIVCIGAPCQALGQRVGVVWDPPEDPIRAEADLRTMSRIGLKGVRMPWEEGQALAHIADTLGLTTFLDLELYYPTAAVLRDTLSWGTSLLSRANGAHAGLAYAPQSEDPAVCVLLRELGSAVPDTIQTYFTSVYPYPDPCTDAVDSVLYLNPGPKAPADTWLAGIGYPAQADGAAQASALAELLRTRVESPGWTFIHRWADGSPGSFGARPLAQNWGLVGEDGGPRPAISVVEGLLVRGQTVFDRSGAASRRPHSTPYVLTGWILILGLLGIRLGNPRFSHMVGRYFTAHGIYRTSVADGREPLSTPNVVVLLTVSAIIGVVAQLALAMAADHSAYEALWYWSPAWLRSASDTLMDRPMALSLVLTSAAAVLVLVWMVAWHAVVGNRNGATFSQVLTLSIWPQWPVLLTLPVIMLAPDSEALVLGSAAWIVVSGLWGTTRTIWDAAVVLRLRPVASLVLWLLSPVVVVGVLSVTLLSGTAAKLAYLRSLIF